MLSPKELRPHSHSSELVHEPHGETGEMSQSARLEVPVSVQTTRSPLSSGQIEPVGSAQKSELSPQARE